MPKLVKHDEDDVLAAQPGETAGSGTREVLLDAAERMFAEHGFDGISLRRIGLATGQGNSAAIQYHFGNKQNLIREIMLRRMERFERLRRELLDEVIEQGTPVDLVGLLKVLYLPLTDAQGCDLRYLSARLNLHFQMSDYQPPLDPVMAGPSRKKAFEILAERLPLLSREELNKRLMHMTGMMCLALLDRHRQMLAGTGQPLAETTFFTNLFSTMVLMIQVPSTSPG